MAHPDLLASLRSCCLGTLLVLAPAAAQGPPSGDEPPPPGAPDGPPGFPPGPGPGRPGGPMSEERRLVEQFDEDDDGRLADEELEAVLEMLRREPGREPRRGGRRGAGGPEGPGGPGGAGVPGGPDRRAIETRPGPRISPADVENFPDAGLFDPDVVRTVFIDFDRPDWEECLELLHDTDVDLPATMTVDGVVHPGVGVRFRGASSYMMIPRGAKRSFNIAVDHVDPERRIGGQNTLNFLNAHGDPSMLSTQLYAHLAAPHLPAPRANFVRVVVNGESWGVFVNAEQFNKAFLRRHWKEFDGDGARWKVRGSPQATGGLDYRGADLAPYRERYEIKSKDREEDWRDLVNLCRILTETPIEELEQAIAPILDLDGVLWFLALDAATANSDGYWVRSSDYSIYKDPDGVFHLLPHDMNESFKLRGGGGPGGPGGRGSRGQRPPAAPGGGQPPPPPGGGMEDAPPPPQGGRQRRSIPRDPGGAPPDVAPIGPPPGARGPRGGGAGGLGGPGGAGGGRLLVELDPLVGLDDPTKPLRSRLLAVPSLRARYLANIRAIAEEMEWSRLAPFIAAQRAVIEAHVAEDTRKLTSTAEFLDATSPEQSGSLRRFLEGRSRFLLAKPPATPSSAEPSSALPSSHDDAAPPPPGTPESP